MCVCELLSSVQFFVSPWTVACQAPLPMEFSKQEYWSGLPFPAPGDLPHPGIKPRSPALQADSLPSEPPGKPQIQYSTMLLFFKSLAYKNTHSSWNSHWVDDYQLTELLTSPLGAHFLAIIVKLPAILKKCLLPVP